MKKIPQRTCIGCNSQKNKCDLIRIVINKEGLIFVDKTGKANGRGAYICNDLNCLEKMIKTKRLEKAFDMEISNDVYDELREEITSQN